MSSQYWNLPWDALTERQKHLDRSIRSLLEATKKGYAIHNIPVTQNNVALIMQKIGAKPSEASFVEQRMLLYVNCDEKVRKADEYLEYIQKRFS